MERLETFVSLYGLARACLCTVGFVLGEFIGDVVKVFTNNRECEVTLYSSAQTYLDSDTIFLILALHDTTMDLKLNNRDAPDMQTFRFKLRG